jgi:hypothetical protein
MSTINWRNSLRHDGQSIYVDLFATSLLDWPEQGLVPEQATLPLHLSISARSGDAHASVDGWSIRAGNDWRSIEKMTDIDLRMMAVCGAGLRGGSAKAVIVSLGRPESTH